MATPPPTNDRGSPTPTVGASTEDAIALGTILEAARHFVPHSHLGICVARGTDRYATLVGTDPLVFTLDDLQYDLDEGPTLTALLERHTVVVDDAESEPRWPSFTARAVDLGLRSHVGVPITLRDETPAALNVYSTVHQHVDADGLAATKLFAEHTASAVQRASREDDVIDALKARRAVGIAIGLLMERFELDEEEALAHLTGLSERGELTVEDIAEHLVKQSNDLRQWTRTRQFGSPFGAPFGDAPEHDES